MIETRRRLPAARIAAKRIVAAADEGKSLVEISRAAAESAGVHCRT
jgi:hypothetical protein